MHRSSSPLHREVTTRAPSLREAVAAVIRWIGIPTLTRRTICRRRATIVVYHDPPPQVLDKHLGYLSKRYSLISLSQLTDALRENKWHTIPTRSLVVTIDDGHKNNAQLLSVCREHGLSPTIFACSHLIDTHRHFWWTGAESIAQEVKRLPHRDALTLLERKTGYLPRKDYPSRDALTAAELHTLNQSAEIGSHTCFHPILSNCDFADCQQEILTSKSTLEELLGRRVLHFSYPNGDYGSREESLVADAGYLSARTLDTGWVGADSDPFRLKAMCIQDDASINLLSAQVTGVFQYVRYLRKGSWNGRRPWGLL